MSEYRPHRRLEDGRWLYMVITSAGPRPIGYCAEGCPEHDDPEGAVAHFQEYQINHAGYAEASGSAELQHQCEYPGCPQLTASYARVEDGRRYILCAEHLNREGLVTVIESPSGLEAP